VPYHLRWIWKLRNETQQVETNPFSDPNQPLQLTAESCGFNNVSGLAAGFGLSRRFGKPPPQLNFGR